MYQNSLGIARNVLSDRLKKLVIAGILEKSAGPGHPEYRLTEKGIAKRQTASVYLKQLADIGVLKEQEAGKEKLFIHPKLMQLLTRDDNKVAAYR